MNVNDVYLDEFIGNVKAHRCTLVSGVQKISYLVKYYCSNGIPIQSIFRGLLPITSGPTIVWPPGTSGYVITVTAANPYAAFKQMCLAAIIVTCGKEAVNEYEKYSDCLDILYKDFPSIKEYLEELLIAFLA